MIPTKNENATYQALDQQHYLQTFRRFPLTLVRGRGARVWDIDGKEYIDALGGIAVNSVGHCHPKVTAAIQRQAAELIHISNFYLSKPQAELSQKLVALSGLDRVFLANSGAEAVEGAIKIARKYAHHTGRGGTVLSFEGSFHGRTLATIATGKKQMQAGFGPIPHGFQQLPFNDLEAVKGATDAETAAILVEPIQGEGGIRVAERAFLEGLRAWCDQEGLVLIFDEIQCGMGRTGKMFAKDHLGIAPDIMTLAKALGGGVPIGAVLSNAKTSAAIEYGDHGTTFGGNPLACAAALATIEALETEGLLQQAAEKGAWLKGKLAALNTPALKEVRGEGLMIGAEFDFETKPLVQKMLEHGVLANATAGNVLRLLPPLNISYAELETVLRVLQQSLTEITVHA
jgi:acetylornithine/N-succinyldiaminopimelate aminotransferase